MLVAWIAVAWFSCGLGFAFVGGFVVFSWLFACSLVPLFSKEFHFQIVF
jgi:hypothetical protein